MIILDKMKKLMFLFVFALFTFVANAQNQAKPVNEGDAKYFSYTGSATTDTVNSATGYSYVYWNVGLDNVYLYTISATIHEISGSATAQVTLEGSNEGVNWYLVDTLQTFNTQTEAQSATGTVVYSDLSTGLLWKQLRAKLTISTTGVWYFDYIRFRAVGKNN